MHFSSSLSYKACCENYYLLLDDNCTKCVDVAASYHAQRQRVNFYVNKVNVLISDAVKSEISKLELEIQRSECELQQAIMNSNIERVNETVGNNVSICEPMMKSSLQENNTSDVYTVIPPPPMFSDMVTSTPSTAPQEAQVSVKPTESPINPWVKNFTELMNVTQDTKKCQSSEQKCVTQETRHGVLPQRKNLNTGNPKVETKSKTLDATKDESFPSLPSHMTTADHVDASETIAPPPPAFADQSASIVEALVTTMDKMSATRDLPAVSVMKFDGSPEKYPAFRLRFKQLVESKPLDDTVKMTRLLQFLEGPALTAVQRYETIPGGLTKALDILKDRFGRPYHVVKACVDSMTKGPAINSSDHQALQRFADEVQANYDTLAAMGYLSEINTDNLEKILSRLSRGAQGKFVEHLNSLERKGQVMPSFKDVVDFLRDRAHVVNHPFLSQSSQPISKVQVKQPIKTTYVKSSTFVTTTTTPTKEPCLVCSKDHRLYQCDAFKAKSSRERTEIVKNNRLCFNCLSSNHHVKQCKTTGRCRVNGCGKPHHTLLHHERKKEKSDSPTT